MPMVKADGVYRSWMLGRSVMARSQSAVVSLVVSSDRRAT
jgi:hypothetical protein